MAMACFVDSRCPLGWPSREDLGTFLTHKLHSPVCGTISFALISCGAHRCYLLPASSLSPKLSYLWANNATATKSGFSSMPRCNRAIAHPFAALNSFVVSWLDTWGWRPLLGGPIPQCLGALSWLRSPAGSAVNFGFFHLGIERLPVELWYSGPSRARSPESPLQYRVFDYLHRALILPSQRYVN